jgi:hypothetical protein
MRAGKLDKNQIPYARNKENLKAGSFKFLTLLVYQVNYRKLQERTPKVANYN